MIEYHGEFGSAGYTERRREIGRNSTLIRAKNSYGDDVDLLMTFFGRFWKYLRLTAGGNGPKSLLGKIFFFVDQNWRDPVLSNLGVAGAECFAIEAGSMGRVMYKFRMVVPDSVADSTRNDLTYFVTQLECKKACGFIPHPNNPDRQNDRDWFNKRHVFFMKGFTADADVRVNESGKALLLRLSD